MYKKQLGRRNLTDEQRTVLIGKMYEARKQSHGGQLRGSRQNDDSIHSGRTVMQIAKELGVGQKTVERAEKFAKGLDKIAEVSPEAAGKILAGNSGINKAAVMDLVKKDETEVKKFAESVVSGESKPKGTDPHVIREAAVKHFAFTSITFTVTNRKPMGREVYTCIHYILGIFSIPSIDKRC